MRRLSFVPLLLAAVLLTGCTQSTAPAFEGTEGAVAQVVDDLQTAGKRGDAEKICSQILSRSLVTKLDAPGTSCAKEIDQAIKDAEDFTLTVRDVTVTGDQATAKVQSGEDGPTATFRFSKEDNRWKASDLAGT
jgi:hypothetical protein